MSLLASPNRSAGLRWIGFVCCDSHLEENCPLRQVAIDGGIPYRTAQRSLTRYRQFGLTALARKRRADIGVHRAVSTNIKSAIQGLALQKPPLPISALYRQVLRVARDFGEKAPCYGVIYNIVRSLPTDLLTLAHRGTKAYSEAFDL